MKQNIAEIVKTVATAAMGALIIMQFVVPTTVFGNSMEPNFSDRDYVLLEKQAYAGEKEPERGDVIVFKSHLKEKDGKDMKLIKRVIGVEGDKIAVKDGKVYVNGEALKEEYIKDGTTSGEVKPVTVPKGSVFCMGDNRLHSVDSRYREVGFIDKSDIIGKVFMRLLPFDKIGLVKDE